VNKARATKLCTALPNVCGSSLRNLLHVALLGSGIWRGFIDFWKVYAVPNVHVILVKSKVHPRTGHLGAQGEYCTFSLTPALDECEWPMPRPGRFSHGKSTRYTFYRKLGEHQSRSGVIMTFHFEGSQV
jgi:hypothetical protein